jgi:hypothetical protein
VLWKYVHGKLTPETQACIARASWDFYRNWQIKLALVEGTPSGAATAACHDIEATVKALAPLDFCKDKWANIICRREQREAQKEQSSMLLLARDVLQDFREVPIADDAWTFDWISGELYIARPHDLRVGWWNRRKKSWSWDVHALAHYGFDPAKVAEKWEVFSAAGF